jgi:hypothetical protein
VKICHTLLQYLEEQTILNVLSILAGAGDQYLEPVPRPDPEIDPKTHGAAKNALNVETARYEVQILKL